MTPEETHVLNAIAVFGRSLATIRELESNLKMDRVEVRRWVHRLVGAGYVQAHRVGTIGVICYSITTDGRAELMRGVIV
jgi:DNA-binding MarR family transcriptional regulator